MWMSQMGESLAQAWFGKRICLSARWQHRNSTSFKFATYCECVPTSRLRQWPRQETVPQGPVIQGHEEARDQVAHHWCKLQLCDTVINVKDIEGEDYSKKKIKDF